MADDEEIRVNPFVPIAPATEKRHHLSTEEYLKRNSEAICNETLNKRNFESASLDLLAPNVIAMHETYAVCEGRDALIENLKQTLQAIPNYHADILNTTVVVDERKGCATVYLHLFLNGMPDGIRRESVNVLSWERNDSQWLLTRHAGMRGPPADIAPFGGL